MLPWSLLAGEYASGGDVPLDDLIDLLAELEPSPAPNAAATTTTAFAALSTQDPTETLEQGLSLGAIVGIAVGAIVVVAIIVVIVVYVAIGFASLCNATAMQCNANHFFMFSPPFSCRSSD